MSYAPVKSRHIRHEILFTAILSYTHTFYTLYIDIIIYKDNYVLYNMCVKLDRQRRISCRRKLADDNHKTSLKHENTYIRTNVSYRAGIILKRSWAHLNSSRLNLSNSQVNIAYCGLKTHKFQLNVLRLFRKIDVASRNEFRHSNILYD